MKACDVGDVQMIETCVQCGAWMDYTMPRDPAQNTALHLAVLQCDNFQEYVQRGQELGITLDKETGKAADPDNKGKLVSSLDPGDDEKKRQEILEQICDWKQKHDNDILAIHILCGPGGRCPWASVDKENKRAHFRDPGYSDPLKENAEGKTAIDFAKDKDPIIEEMLLQSVDRLRALRKQAQDEDSGVAEE